MINILSYVGMNMQSEVCLWTLVGLVRTIFDATLFKVNANLIQVWQMSMPEELSLPVQHVLRTMISGIMLVQCFTVYVYLASYIVLLYPVFLEERPTLVLPWLLLAAIRKLLCELTSLALGLGTCVLLGPAKPPCIKFVIVKIVAILPVFYMWMLVYSYYHALKVAASFKTFPVVHQTCRLDYGLELAVRRRRTKSLFGEQQLRETLVAGLYADRTSDTKSPVIKLAAITSLTKSKSSETSILKHPLDDLQTSNVSDKYADINNYEDWLGNETAIPRDSDRIIEQIAVMLLRIAAYLKRDGTESIKSHMFNTDMNSTWAPRENLDTVDVTDTPPFVGNSKGPTVSYIHDYPHIFMKRLSTEVTQPDVWQAPNLGYANCSKSIQSGSVTQSISSTETSNKLLGLEVNKQSIDNDIEKNTLSKSKDAHQNSKLSVIASEDIVLNNLDDSNLKAKFILQECDKPSTSKNDQNDNKDNSEHVIYFENKNDDKISFELLPKKSGSNFLNRLNDEDQVNNVMKGEKSEIAHRSDSVSNQPTNSQLDKKTADKRVDP